MNILFVSYQNHKKDKVLSLGKIKAHECMVVLSPNKKRNFVLTQKKIIIINIINIIIYRFINLEDYEGGFETSDVDQMLADIGTNYDQWCTAFAALVVDPSDPPSVEKFGKCLKRMGVEIGLPLAKTVFFSDHRSVLDKVVAPVTLVHTKRDLVVPASVVTFMHSRIRGESTVEIVNTEGHFPQLTAHEEFLEIVFAALG